MQGLFNKLHSCTQSATKAYKMFACDTRWRSEPLRPSNPSGEAALRNGCGGFSSSGIGINLAKLQVPQGGAKNTAIVLGCLIHSKTMRRESSSVRSSVKMLALAPLLLSLSTAMEFVKPFFLNVAVTPPEPQKSSRIKTCD